MTDRKPIWEQVSDFVRENWDGLYVTTRTRDMQGFVSCWESRLHGPTGPVVFTGVREDGTMEDLTRD